MMTLQPPQRITVSAAVAKAVAKDALYADRLAVARGETPLGGRDLVTALYFLCYGGDRELRTAGVHTLRQQSAEALVAVAILPDLSPRILHFLAQVRGNEPLLFNALLDHPSTPPETLAFLLEHAERPLFSQIFARESVWLPSPEAVNALLRNPHLTDEERSVLEREEEPLFAAETAAVDLPAGEDEEAPLDEDEDEEDDEDLSVEEKPSLPDDENYSKYQLALDMGVSEKIKMALTGDKEWRNIFLKDSNKLVNTAVLKNPRVTDGEVVAICKNRTSSEELIRIVLLNKDWIKAPAIRSALVSHPKTPVGWALRFMAYQTEKELKALGKSKNVSQVVVTAARRMLAEKAKKK